MKVAACKCGSTDLMLKRMSETGAKWVFCDSCGNHSTPVFYSDSNKIIEVWNKEQEPDAQD